MKYPASITEKCQCGASIDYVGGQVLAVADAWRRNHQCTTPKPGPCWNQPKDTPTWPHGGEIRCGLRAGHEGAHEADRGSLGGTAVWTNEGDDQ